MVDDVGQRADGPMSAAQRIPGDPWIWALFAADMLMFSVFFVSFAVDRRKQTDVFAEAQEALYQGVGLLNTLLLLLGSLLVVVGLQSMRAGGRRARSAFFGALACGAAFAVAKVVEWSLLIDAGYRAANQFFVYYFSLTGLHFVHVCAGLLILAILAVRAGRPASAEGTMKLVESGCGYWHLVDLLWLIMFSLLYLVN